MINSTTQQLITWVCIFTISIACLLMHFVLRWGLPVGTETAEQIQFIASNAAIWKLSWFSWNLAALSLLCFCIFLYVHSSKRLVPKFGICCVAIAVIPDLIAEYHLSFGLHRLAEAGLTDEFVVLQNHGMRLTGVLANGLYNIGGLSLTISLLAYSKLSKGVAAIGIVSWLLGLSLSYFTLVGNFKGSELATALSMSLNLGFMVLINVHLFGRRMSA